MGWQQGGLIFKPEGEFEWSQSHAQVPTAVELSKEIIRIYYATRDRFNRSRTSFIDVDSNDPTRVLYVHNRPIMNLGKPGCHDEDGVMVSSVLKIGSEIWMYYTGWSRGGSIPYRTACGLAISKDGGYEFTRAFDGPIVDRTSAEPHFTNTPYVVCNSNFWRMWYGSGTSWVLIDDKFEPIYVIKYAESKDGFQWNQPNKLCITPKHELESNVRPSLLVIDGRFEMWFCYRHSIGFRDGLGSYRIGHATSTDGLTWNRLEDPIGLLPGRSKWSMGMMAYPCVIQIGSRRLMFHNGDGFGKSGFGFSKWMNKTTPEDSASTSINNRG